MPAPDRPGEPRRGVGRAASRAAPLRLACLALLVLLTGRVAAQVHNVTVGDVQVAVIDAWPEGLVPGWFPISVRAANNSSEAARVTFTFRDAYDFRSRSVATLEIPAGTVTSARWLLPSRGVDAHSSHGLFLDVRDEDGSSDHAVMRGSSAPPMMREEYTLVSRARDIWAANCVEHADLPTDWRAYTSLARLVLYTDQGVPSEEVREALRTWVAAGGVLQVVGPADDLGFPADTRFARDGGLKEHVLAESRFGFGTVQVTDGEHPEVAPGWGATVQATSSTRAGEHMAFPPGLELVSTPIPGLSNLPLGALTAILVGFYIIMGPVQFSWLKRRGAPPAKLLVTTPILGLGFAALLFCAGLLMNGLSTRESVSSITWLDQPRRHVSVLAKRTVYSGSVFGTALRYGAGTATQLLEKQRPFGFRVSDGDGLSTDLDRHVLSGGWLPVRSPTEEVVVRSATARQRVAVELEVGRTFLVNGLETGLRDVWYRDADGSYLHAEGEVPVGGRVELRPSEAPGLPGLSIGHVQSAALTYGSRTQLAAHHLPDELPVRCVAALMDDSPFLDDGGVPRETVLSRHLLVVVLEEAP